MARRGQGVFKKRVALQETHCRITEVNEISHLRASHIKPWRYCEDHTEKLNGNNGLLLTPTVDHLFDRGFISFESAGGILVSPIVESSSLSRMGIDLSIKDNVGTFNEEQQYFLEYHRKEVFLS
jgi:predicted restriction endonuclease